MTEMEINSNENADAAPKKTESHLNLLGQDPEDEKERTIAKAALSIAELGNFMSSVFLSDMLMRS
jgi:hypothetical protein